MDMPSKKITARGFKSIFLEKEPDNGSHFVTVTATPPLSIFFNLTNFIEGAVSPKYFDKLSKLSVCFSSL